MFKKIFAALVYSLTHPNLSAAAVAQTAHKVVEVTEKVGGGLQIAHDVIATLPEGNSKDAAMGALAQASVAVAKAVAEAHTVEDTATVVGTITGQIKAPAHEVIAPSGDQAATIAAAAVAA